MSSSRRDFLKFSLAGPGLWSMLPTVPDFLARSACAAQLAPGGDQKVLVVVQLAGGNDGLNTIVPYTDDHYGRNRRTLRLTAREVLPIDSLLGFHPAMTAFDRLYKEGLLSIVQGVGYPNQNQDHDISMRIWQTGRRDDAQYQLGWAGRAADVLLDSGKCDVPAIFIGQTPQPFGLIARKAIVPTARTLEDCTLRAGSGAAGPDAGLLPSRSNTEPLLDYVCRQAAAARAISRKIERSGAVPASVDYPAIPFAEVLQIVARLIRADTGIRIFYTELGGNSPGGFDNHAGQRDNHASLLRQLSESIYAFVEDLRRNRLLDRVALMTFSEFGRTLAENGRRGTDHGAAAPLFLVGGRTCGGLVGRHPDLAETEQAGGIKHHTDFRCVYATILEKWLGIPSQTVLGQHFASLGLFA